MFISKKSGFSLVELMIAAGLIGGLSLIFMQVLKSGNKGQIDVMNFADYSSMRDEINFLISNPRSCKASLAGFSFKGSSIKATPKDGVELWSSDQVGARSTKKFYASAKFGKTEIETITFSMPDYTAGADWAEGTDQGFTAELRVSGKKSSMGATKSFNDITKSINVTFDTNSSGISLIKDCQVASTSSSGIAGYFTIWGNATCPAPLETIKSGKSFASSTNNGGNPGTDIVCNSGTINRKIFMINAAHSGYTWEDPLDCAVCSSQGARFCFTNFGQNSCPTGFSKAYSGKMFQAAWYGSGSSGKMICREGAANNGIFVVNSALSGYEWINGESCAECCRD